MVRLASLLTLTASLGCAVEPMSTEVVSANSAVKASLVTVIDGKYFLYRVNVGDKDIFFITKDNLPLETTAKWTECNLCGSKGETCCHPESQTVLAVR